MANIELPKDAKGREIPLDTMTLYTKDGAPRDIANFVYYPRCAITEREWTVAFMDGSEGFVSQMYLTPPDSWEKLEEDLRRASERDVVISYCRYFTAGKCADCPISNGASCCVIHKDERAFADIFERIRKLRGEDE